MLNDTPTPSGFKDRLFAEAHQLANEQPSPAPIAKSNVHLAGLLALGQQLRAATEQPITFRPALFWHDEEPVIWPRSVNLIQGQTGVHKSRVAELFGSAMLRTDPPPDEALGIEFRPVLGEAYKLLYVDTERNTSDQLPFAIQQLKGRAGFDLSDHPLALDYTSLVLLPRAARFPALAEYLAHHRLGFSGHLVVILDVLSDCVADFNDVAASLELMDLLNVAVNEQDATFLCVIHENPGGASNKARGHLGTEAGNKASTALQVGFMKEGGKSTPLLQLMYLKRRYAAPGLTFFAVYDEATRGLVRATPELPDARTGPTRPDLTGKVLTLLTELLATGPVAAGVLEAKLAARLARTTRTVRGYLTDLLVSGTGYMTDAAGCVCQLTKHKEPTGLTVLYALTPVINSS